MISSLGILFVVIVFFSIGAFFSQLTHFLMVLLRLEVSVLSLAVLFSLRGVFSFDCFRGLVVLTFGACEAALGLALLVSMGRGYGNDYLKQLVINKC